MGQIDGVVIKVLIRVNSLVVSLNQVTLLPSHLSMLGHVDIYIIMM
jgi:hypothetical protein